MSDDDLLRRVEPAGWLAAVGAARDEGFDHFDWLGCVDEIGREDTFRVIVRLLRLDPRTGSGPVAVRLSTEVPRDEPELASIGSVFAGAGWHEREGTDLFGVTFLGVEHRDLLIEDPYAPPPLRKDQLLGARSAIDWPGAKEPGESGDGSAPSRRRMMPPGVPDPAVWGDRDEPAAADPAAVAESLAGGRVRRSRGQGPSR